MSTRRTSWAHPGRLLCSFSPPHPSQPNTMQMQIPCPLSPHLCKPHPTRWAPRGTPKPP